MGETGFETAPLFPTFQIYSATQIPRVNSVVQSLQWDMSAAIGNKLRFH